MTAGGTLPPRATLRAERPAQGSLPAQLGRQGLVFFAAFALLLFLAARLGGYDERDLPLCNALLNGVASVLLVLGLLLIKRGRREAHRRVMVQATLVSACFLASYLWYHFGVQSELGPTPFRREGTAKLFYLGLLASHVLLAIVELPLILCTLWLAQRQDWTRHRRLARWTWPVWFYVSVTGVLVYLALYAWNPPPAGGLPG